MAKYLLTFEKTGYLKYTSHLDNVRLFSRSFRKCNMDIDYSQGFNPHPKMSFPLPLSLGYTGENELLEIETKRHYEVQEILDTINPTLPDGMRIKEGVELPSDWDAQTGKGKNIAAKVTDAIYRFEIPKQEGISGPVKAAEFISQPEIMEEKTSKKTGKTTTVDIKPLIKSLKVDVVDDKNVMTTKIAQGSHATLSPELLLKSYLKFAGFTCDRSEIEVARVQIFWDDDMYEKKKF